MEAIRFHQIVGKQSEVVITNLPFKGRDNRLK